jgi:hypothetical protein
MTTATAVSHPPASPAPFLPAAAMSLVKIRLPWSLVGLPCWSSVKNWFYPPVT